MSIKVLFSVFFLGSLSSSEKQIRKIESVTFGGASVSFMGWLRTGASASGVVSNKGTLLV